MAEQTKHEPEDDTTRYAPEDAAPDPAEVEATVKRLTTNHAGDVHQALAEATQHLKKTVTNTMDSKLWKRVVKTLEDQAQSQRDE